MDYQGNSNKSKEPKPEKQVQRIVNTEVLVQKKSLGQKFKEVFIKTDVKSVSNYVIFEVIIPATINMIVDASSKGVARLMYGERGLPNRGVQYGGYSGPRTTYNTPVSRPYGTSPTGRPTGPRPMVRERNPRDNLIFTSREEAAATLEQLNDIIDQYEVASVGDLNESVGLRGDPIDNKWGWAYLGNAQIRQVREGFLLDLPPAEPIQ